MSLHVEMVYILEEKELCIDPRHGREVGTKHVQ